MAHTTFNELWRDAMKELESRISSEQAEIDLLQADDTAKIFQQQTKLYIDYIQIFKKLEESYDQMAQPQKRLEIKTVLDATLGRILEIKDILVKMNQNEFIKLDDVLLEMKLTPSAIEFPVPRYFVEDRKKELEERDKLLAALISQINLKQENEGGDKAENSSSSDNSMTLEEAIKIIQINERGRQGRQKAKEAREMRANEKKKAALNPSKVPLDQVQAATMIQRTFLGYLVRKKTKEMRKEELSFIGMDHQMINKETDPYEKAQQTRNRRKLIQNQNEQEYQQALVSIRQKLHEQNAPETKEKLQDEIRKWFLSHKELTGKFPLFPSAAQGGSLKIFADQAQAQQADQKKLETPDSGKPKTPSKAPKKLTSSLSSSGRKKKEEVEKVPVVLPPSKFTNVIQTNLAVYNKVWFSRDESGNLAQKHDTELIKEALWPDVEKEIRLAVDEQLREELEKLRNSIEGKKKKKANGKKKKVGAPVKRAVKTPKKKATRKNKDPTHDRNIESLFGELVTTNIIKKCPPVKLKDFIGDYEYNNENPEGFHTTAEVKRAIVEHCILPLGSVEVHKNSPLVKTVLLYGAAGSGKTMLTRMIATETGSLFLDLTPDNVLTKHYEVSYIRLLLHIAFKVAKIMAPSVILIDEIETIFSQAKKPAKDNKIKEGEGEEDPRKEYKKALIRQIKTLKAGDRVLIIGNTRYPQKGKKPLIAFSNKVFHIPLPNYSTRHLLWRNMIPTFGGKIPDQFDFSALTKISDGFSTGSICSCISDTLMAHRLHVIDKKPLTTNEFITPLAKLPSIKTEEEALRKFQSRIPIKKIKFGGPEPTKRSSAASSTSNKSAPTKAKAKKK